MKNENDGGSAFPHQDPRADRLVECHQGMSLRDWFASTAKRQDYEPYLRPHGSLIQTAYTEKARYAYADAMLRAREGE